MELKSSRPPSRRVFSLFRWAVLAALLAAGVFAVDRLDIGLDLRRRALKAGTAAARWAVARVVADPLTLQLDVGYEHFEKLAFKRQEALERGILVSSPDDFVPGRLRVGDHEVRVKLRLKGDLYDHWADPYKWSFRIVVKDGETVLGMRQFSIQHPETRLYMKEWVMHDVLRREGLPALRYDFVHVVLNGRDLGIYALEEHFEKRLVENSRRREGPLVRFDEDLCWSEIDAPGLATTSACVGSGVGSYLAADIDAFHTQKLLETPESTRQLVAAVGLLEGFRRGALAASEVFDAALMARHLALLDLLDRPHAGFWRNVRFYYNPITQHLEPIAFDGGAVGQPTLEALAPAVPAFYRGDDPNYAAYHYGYFAQLFRDPTLYRLYLREVERVSRPEYLAGLLEDLDEPLRAAEAVLHLEYPSRVFDAEALEARRRFLRHWVDPAKLVHGHWQGVENGRLELAVANVQYLDVELLGLRHGARRIPLPAPLRLPGRDPHAAISYVPVSIPLPPELAAGELAPEDFRLEHRLLGLDDVRQGALFPWPQIDVEALRGDLARRAPNAVDFDFVVLDADARIARIRPGVWFLREDLVVPEGFTLQAGAGVHLTLEDGASVVVRGPVELVGREDAPVLVRSATGTGGGLLVIDAGRGSRLEYVRFENLSAPEQEAATLTGAVTFYESPVVVRHAEFVDARAEDALNVVRTHFEIENSAFRGAASDALDVDFCEGTLRRSAFLESGNDAVDLSGSVARLEAVRIRGAGDKGVSVGERSTATAFDLSVERAAIGVASKDQSRVTIVGLRVAETPLALAAYQKKSEFGGGRLSVEKLETQSVAERAVVEPGSEIRVDGQGVPPDRARAAALTDD